MHVRIAFQRRATLIPTASISRRSLLGWSPAQYSCLRLCSVHKVHTCTVRQPAISGEAHDPGICLALGSVPWSSTPLLHLDGSGGQSATGPLTVVHLAPGQPDHLSSADPQCDGDDRQHDGLPSRARLNDRGPQAERRLRSQPSTEAHERYVRTTEALLSFTSSSNVGGDPWTCPWADQVLYVPMYVPYVLYVVRLRSLQRPSPPKCYLASSPSALYPSLLFSALSLVLPWLRCSFAAGKWSLSRSLCRQTWTCSSSP